MTSRNVPKLALTLLLAFGATYYDLELLSPRVQQSDAEKGLGNGYSWGGDFYPIWVTVRELLRRGSDPYSPEMTRQIQTGLYGLTLEDSNFAGRRPDDLPPNYRTFAYPLYTDLIFASFAALSFPAARIVMAILLVPLIVLSVYFWLRGFSINAGRADFIVCSVLALSSYPAMQAWLAEQAGLLVAALLAGAVAAIAAEKFKTAGMLLALATIKPQMSALLILWLALWAISDWRRRKNLLLTFGAAIAVLWLVSEILVPGWLGQWIRVLHEYRTYAGQPLLQLFFGPSAGGLASALLLLSFAAAGWRLRKSAQASAEFAWAVAAAVVVTVVALLGAGALYDYFLLLPVAMLFWAARSQIWGRSPVGKTLFSLTAALLLAHWIAACAVTLASFCLRHGGAQISELFLRTPQWPMLFLPFALLALLFEYRLRTGCGEIETASRNERPG